MPKVFIPHRWPEHRIAAIALYRALLTQSRNLLPDLTAQHRTWLTNTLRNRFRLARFCPSLRQLRVNFEAGYEALDRLDAAVAGDGEAKEGIVKLLGRASWRTRNKLLPGRGIGKREMRRNRERDGLAPPAAPAPLPPPTDLLMQPFAPPSEHTKSIFSRPLPLSELSGYRRVPVLFNASMIPVLRFKRPQPKNLSGYINGRIDQRQKRHELRQALEVTLVLADEEDKWDEIVAGMVPEEGSRREDGGEEGRDGNGAAWRDETEAAVEQVQAQIDREKMLSTVMAQKFQAVVDRERGLFESERVERRFRRWRERKDAREEAKEKERRAAEGEA